MTAVIQEIYELTNNLLALTLRRILRHRSMIDILVKIAAD